jgi:tetratricopeptide (TPR) repeat protein
MIRKFALVPCVGKFLGTNRAPNFMKQPKFIQACERWTGLLIFILLPLICFAQTNAGSFDEVAAQAAAAREQGDIQHAIELYRQGLQLNAKWADGWWFLGSLHYGADEYTAARDALTHFIELTPDAGPALALRGLCEFEIGEYDQSLSDIQHGISLGAANRPRNETILRYHEALLLAHKGNFEGALQRYAALARSNPSNPELLLGIGLAGLRTPLLPKELKTDKQDLYGAAGNGAFLFWTKDRKGAEREFRNLFQHFPAAPNAHYFYGYLLFPMDPDAAIVEFKRELEIAPANASAQTMVAWDALIRNDYAEALAYSQKAAAQDPALPMAQLVLGRALVETGDVQSGIEHLENELQMEPGNFEAHLALAKAYSKSGRSQEARRERELCLQMAQSGPTLGGTPQSARP